MTILRTIAAVVLGVAVLFALVVAVELFSAVVHPFPDGFQGTEAEICQHVERYPGWVLAAVVPAWALAAFAGTWTASRVGNVHSAWTVGALGIAAVVFNLSMLPYPVWFKLTTLLAVPAAAGAGVRRSTSVTTQVGSHVDGSVDG